MDKDTLLRRKETIEQQFNNLQDEIKRIQGEYRLVNDLLAALEQPAEEKKPKRIRKVEVQEDAEN
jgi:hypothetical protein